jgi:hypothetical protein
VDRFIFSLATSNLAELAQSRLHPGAGSDDDDDDHADLKTAVRHDDNGGGGSGGAAAGGAGGGGGSAIEKRARLEAAADVLCVDCSEGSESSDAEVEVFDITGDGDEDSPLSVLTPKRQAGATAEQQQRAQRRRAEVRRLARAAAAAAGPAAPVQNVQDGNISFHNEAVIRRLKLQCSICLESIDSTSSSGNMMPFVTQCGHIYHKVCIKTALETAAVSEHSHQQCCQLATPLLE